MMENWQTAAKNFLENEKEFHLGFIPSEVRNPLTMSLDIDFRQSTARGVKTLLACDHALTAFFRDVLRSREYARLVEAMRTAGNIVFSGCGATGRLAVLLESAWREIHPDHDLVSSIITGGDFALVKSVENFEDYQGIGRKQAEEMRIGKGDLLIGITATGETASILGSAVRAAELGAEVFMLICVPVESTLQLERCRKLYAMPQVTVIAMPIGGMAIAGSTRMQSSTIELAVAASALEIASGVSGIDYADAFGKMLDGLSERRSVASLAAMIDFEDAVYRGHGLIDYLADDLLADIVSDTTERSPTFMIPSYLPGDDADSPQPWAMLKTPRWSTPDAWRRCLHRAPRCLDWPGEFYRELGIRFKNGIPDISQDALMKIRIGNEYDPHRQHAHKVTIEQNSDTELFFHGLPVGKPLTATPLRLFEHLRMKLAMNIISTGAMVKFGRIRENYMIYLNISNKKLIDRGCRIVSELCGLSYEAACHELFRAQAEAVPGESPVELAVRRLGKQVSSPDKPDFGR